MIFVDGGYRGEKFANTIKSMTKVVVKRNELHNFVILPKFCVGE